MKKKHQTDTDYNKELRSTGQLPRRGKNRQHPIRPEINYHRPLNKLRRWKPSSGKTDGVKK